MRWWAILSGLSGVIALVSGGVAAVVGGLLLLSGDLALAQKSGLLAVTLLVVGTVLVRRAQGLRSRDG
ncbi:hypothetical protein QOL99_14590 [Deinococcus sp. MIMF12]|uniref:Uncharacterized protein n=1 Tax=Deinococcus rhizophilus TaxID=3049544 RepID=A0ABT7JJX8_9DEIO|nr:hypothetical protein [Deinococcus rhizophilus]MDL2345367.1 hypothetical protein [Deinococcus rhizophilus]